MFVEKVLSKTKSHLTVSQIYDTGDKEGYVSGVDFRKSRLMDPRKAHIQAITASINLYLRRNPNSDIKSSSDVPKKYFLRSSITEVNSELVHHDKADVILIELRGLKKSQKIKILTERIENTRSEKTVFKDVIVNKPIRNSDVIALVRLRSEFSCELCGWIGFMKENGEFYIEVHHLRMISEGGSDIPENVVALCPNCHRKMHHAGNREELMKEVIEKLAVKGIIVSPTPSTLQAKSSLEI
jgi:predicted HNH restriction endonuclease